MVSRALTSAATISMTPKRNEVKHDGMGRADGEEFLSLFCVWQTHISVNANLQTARPLTDEQLWRLACEGDREAFTGIVRRYQCLICSITYSGCGALGIAEDMAQETFITAWNGLRDLRDPNRLRQWLCGIARNITANAVRQDLRRGGETEVLNEGQPSDEGDSAEQTITREEGALLCRSSQF